MPNKSNIDERRSEYLLIRGGRDTTRDVTQAAPYQHLRNACRLFDAFKTTEFRGPSAPLRIGPVKLGGSLQICPLHLDEKPPSRTSDLCQLTHYDFLDEW
jgi:hypothetical protein